MKKYQNRFQFIICIVQLQRICLFRQKKRDVFGIKIANNKEEKLGI